MMTLSWFHLINDLIYPSSLFLEEKVEMLNNRAQQFDRIGLGVGWGGGGEEEKGIG